MTTSHAPEFIAKFKTMLELMETALLAEEFLARDALTCEVEQTRFAEADRFWRQVQTQLSQIASADAETPEAIRFCLVAERLRQYLDGEDDINPTIWRMALAGREPENETDILIRDAVDLACRHAELTDAQLCH